MADYLSFFLLTAGVLLGVVALWIGIYFFLSPTSITRMDEPNSQEPAETPWKSA